MPASFQEELGSVAAELVNTVNCPAPAPTDENGDRGKGKKRGKDKSDD